MEKGVRTEDEPSSSLDRDNDEPHDKPYLTTRFGRLVDRITYLDIIVLVGLVLGVSSAYFWVFTPFGWGIVDSNKCNVDGLGNALYFSIVTFTSLGYGDLAPQGFGRVMAAVVVLSGLALVSLLVGKVASERQFSLLLLLHTSDCQRRLSAFSDKLRESAVMVQRACEREQTDQLHKTMRELSQRLAALRNYAIFNSHQARMAAFGNASTLGGLFKQMQGAQAACIAAFQSPAADELVCARARRLVKGIAGLASDLAKMQKSAKHDRLGFTISLLNRMCRRFHARRPEPLGDAKSTEALPGLAPIEEQKALLEQWARENQSAWLLAAVWDLLPYGTPQNWEPHQNRRVAAHLGTSNKLAQTCIDALAKAGLIPKRPPAAQAAPAGRYALKQLQQRTNGLKKSSDELGLALAGRLPAEIQTALNACERHIQGLEAMRVKHAPVPWQGIAGTHEARFFAIQLQQAYDRCKQVEVHALGAGDSSLHLAAAGVSARIESLSRQTGNGHLSMIGAGAQGTPGAAAPSPASATP